MMLQNFRIIELAGVLAGPAVGMFFSEMGAQVLKIENQRTGGDVTRQWKLPTEPPEASYSAYYCSVNWHKKVEMLDFSDSKQREKVYEWVKTADIVIANYKQGDDIKLGMDYATLRSYKPDLIYAQLSGFGNDSSRVAFDVVLQAESGFMYMNGEPEGKPVKMPVALIDILAAHQLKEGILVALLRRQQTGEGCRVSVSLFDTAVASLANQATNWLMQGHIASRIGTQHPNIAPYGDMFTTADGKLIVLAVGNDKQFEQLCQVLQQPHIAAQSEFATNTQRVKNRAALIQILQNAIAQYTAAQLLPQLHAQQVPAGIIRNMQEVFELPEAHRLLLNDTLPDGSASQCVRTTVFNIATE